MYRIPITKPQSDVGMGFQRTFDTPTWKIGGGMLLEFCWLGADLAVVELEYEDASPTVNPRLSNSGMIIIDSVPKIITLILYPES